MVELLTTAQMRAVEAEAFAGGLDSRALMERAGTAVVAEVASRWPDPVRVAVLCGPGNNGGDGFVIARLLAAQGHRVSVFLLGDAARLPPDARANHDRLVATQGVASLDEFHPDACDLVVDALFGIGFDRPLAPSVALARLRSSDRPVVAVDLPSGLDADTGTVQAPALRAALTVTFHRAKPGHYLGEGPDHCGELVVVDIGLDAVPVQSVGLVQPPQAARLAKAASAHKYSHGHALVLSGGVGKGGAARLAARAALRVGAGLVTIGCPPAALIENAAQLEAVMLTPVRDAVTLQDRLSDPRISALCVGPGLGLARARDLVPVALLSGRPTVVDADALTAFADDPELLSGALHDGCVLTPHSGEFGRLFPEADLTDPLPAVRAAAARAGCTVLLKGRTTVIASVDGRTALHAAAYGREAPWLATAGAGDVLAGLVTGLLARGMTPFEAATTSAWLHVEAARQFGPGLVAEDLPDLLPHVLRSLRD